MPRNLSSGMLAAIQSGYIRPAFFVSMAFRSGTAHIWTGFGSILWNSITWVGQGKLLGISPMEDGSAVEARGIVITLSGIAVDMLADAISDYKLGAPAAVFFGCLDDSGVVIPDPVQAWSGRMDKPTVRVSGTTATIDIACENRLIDMNNSVDRRRTHDDQTLDHTGDLGFSFISGLQERAITWGQNTTVTTNI